MMTLIEYDGATPTGPLGDIWDIEQGTPEPVDHAQHGSTGAEPMNNTVATKAPAVAATTAASAAATSSAAGGGAQATVEMLDDRFVPPTLTIKAGTTVTWVNKGANWHNISAVDGSFTSALIQPGNTFSVTFTTPGTYKYICRQHARHGMIGTIVVEP
jgi:plastocyanin